MSPQELIEDLKQQGVRLTALGSRLRVRAPVGDGEQAGAVGDPYRPKPRELRVPLFERCPQLRRRL